MWDHNILICLLVIQVAMVTVSRGYSYTGERSIRTSVLSSFAYDRMARPNASTTANVGYNVLVVKNLDVSKKSLTCTGWFTLLWNDERLVWNPVIYDGTEYIHALEEEIWKPEILISNSQEDVGLVSDDHLIYRIKYTGDVEWEPLVSTPVDCGIDVTYFPFDTQECSIELTSWGLPDTELELNPLWNEIKFDEYRDSDTWEIISSWVTKSRVSEKLYNTTEYFSKMIFSIKMSRRPGNYVFNTLVPLIISSFQMTITSLIPLQTGERLIAGYLVLTINSLLLTIFMQQIPDIATTTAILGIFLTGSLCLDYIIVLITVLLVRIRHRQSAGHKPVGTFLRGITLFLKRILCFQETPIEEDCDSLITIPTDDLRKIEKTVTNKKNAVSPERGHGDLDTFTETLKVKETSLPAISVRYDLDLDLHNLKNRKKKKEKHISSTDGNDYVLKTPNNRNDITWEIVAAVFDRLCFFIFVSLKIAYNVILIGNLLYQRRTDA